MACVLDLKMLSSQLELCLNRVKLGETVEACRQFAGPCRMVLDVLEAHQSG